jgi:hypothetical protein
MAKAKIELTVEFLVDQLKKGRLSEKRLKQTALDSGDYDRFMQMFSDACKRQSLDESKIRERAPGTEYKEEFYRKKGYGKVKAPQTEYLEELLRAKGYGKVKSPQTEYQEDLLRKKGYGKVKSPLTEYEEERLRAKGYGKVKAPQTEYLEELYRKKALAYALAVNELVKQGVPEAVAKEEVSKLIKLPKIWVPKKKKKWAFEVVKHMRRKKAML